MNFSAWLLANEPIVRLSCFFGVFTVMACWELYRPFRPLLQKKWFRWRSNLSLVVLNSLLLRVMFPVAAVGVAGYAQAKGFGLFIWLDLPIWLEVLLAVVLLDFLIYAQHVLFHKVPLLWRFHRMHHADPDIDVTTGARFHPVEIVLSMLIKMLMVFLLGPAVVAVILFEVLLNASAMFNHSNIQLPKLLDRVIRWLFVTPDMHRVHHSKIPSETDSNYGFALSCWDRICKTYIEKPAKGQVGVEIGLNEFNDPNTSCRLGGMLMLPFKK
ncbi:sterol desaturase family protein [Neptuniibacter sp. QD29_5]|uniref:sterol desaturase family protein n=1 Tax=Neptuniibacter sp. QD29_5 TaxID=3398207 RepID=UPI0039F4C60F